MNAKNHSNDASRLLRRGGGGLGIGRSFTLVEMLVVIMIMSILMMLLLPALQSTLVIARTTSCLNNQKQIGVAFYVYLDANNGRMPPMYSTVGWGSPHIQELLAASGLGPSSDWLFYNMFDPAKKYNLNNMTPFGKCPTVGSSEALAQTHHVLGDYGFNINNVVYAMERAPRIQQFTKPSTTMLCTDGVSTVAMTTCYFVWDSPNPTNTDYCDPRHNSGCAALFLGGNAGWVAYTDFLTNKNDLWGRNSRPHSSRGP